MLKLTIEAQNADEMKQQLTNLAASFTLTLTFAPEMGATEAIQRAQEQELLPEPKKKGRPPKVETATEEVEANPAQEIVAKATVADESEFMKVKTRCLEVAKIKGRAALETLLDKFSVKRITELSGDQYNAVLEAVEKVLD